MNRCTLLMPVAMLAGCTTMARSGTADAPRSLAGTQWTIASINGTPPTAERKAAIRFDSGRISGNAGCNSFGGGYAVAGNTLTVTQVISTKMACIGADMDQENALFRILAAPMTIIWSADDTLMLRDDAGSVSLALAG